MKIISIIAEYNPMHSGHLYQINKIREVFPNSYIVIIMSGHFMERGSVSIFDKWARARIAVQSGADLVIQTPEHYSIMPAEIYARYNINLIDSLNICDNIAFSTENYSEEKLQEIYEKEIKYNDKIDTLTKKNLKSGLSYPKAFSMAKDELNLQYISYPNDILGFEYIKSLNLLNSKITPIAIKRIGSGYNENEIKTDYPSATSIRKAIKENRISEAKKYILGDIDDNYIRKYSKFDEDFYYLIKYSIAEKINNNSLSRIFSMKEGLDKKIEKVYKNSESLEDLIFKIKSKRYTYTSIKRLLFYILLNYTKGDFELFRKNNFAPSYIRLLSFNDNGRKLIFKIKKKSSLPIITKTANFKPENIYSKKLFLGDIYATNIYNIIKKSEFYDDILVSPFYLNQNK